MIVPRLPLIGLAAATCIPLLGMAVSQPSLALPELGLLAAVMVVVVADALWGRKRLEFIKVELPEKLRWTQKRMAHLEMVFQSTKAEAVHIRIGLGLPDEFEPAVEELSVQLPAQAGKHYVSYACSPRQRGLFRIEGCYFEIISPLRLWDIRGSNPRATEVRVYPNMESERKQVASVFLRTRHSGSHTVRQMGQGREFEKLREYVSGDGYDTVHWKATARRGRPVTKIFQVERTQEIYVIVDTSRLSARLQDPSDPSKGTHLDRYIAAILVLGLAAENQGDLFGLLTFSDGILNFVRARNGKEHYSSVREALYRLESQNVSPDFDEVASFVRIRMRRRALLIYMTDLDDPILMESFQRAAKIISRKHLVMVNMLQPSKVSPVFSNPAVERLNDLYEDLARHIAWHDLRQLALSLRQQGVALSLFSPERFSAHAISNYLLVKQRQLL